MRGRHCLDRTTIEKISTGSKTMKIYLPGDGVCGGAWAWTFLTACLATFCGYDDARAVVDQVKYEGDPA
jgi:hypothetical protein